MKRQYQIHTAKHQFPFFAFPLVSDDVNAYEIVLTAPEDISNCSFEVTAFRADGKKLLGLGRCFDNRATYVMENEMHSVVGDLTVRTAVVSSDGSCLTTNELLFKVEKPNGADAIAAGTNTGVLTQILVNISQMNQELNEKINSSKLEAVSESKMYTDGCVKKLEKSIPACEIEGNAVLVCAQHYVSTDEIEELYTQDSDDINLTVSGDLTVDISAENKYVFFNPSTDEKLICTVFAVLTGDVKELELYAPDTDTTAFTLETFKATYPYYGVLAENTWESANDLLRPAFDYADKKDSKTLDKAKLYADEKVDKPYFPSACSNLENSVFSYEIAQNVMSTDAIVNFYYHDIDNFGISTNLNDSVFYGVTSVFFNPKTKKKILCSCSEYESDLEGAYNFGFVVNEGYILEATTLEEFKAQFPYMGVYSDTYKWKSDVVERSYVDSSIQQAILDSWEVGV